jgi:hypothetical protein
MKYALALAPLFASLVFSSCGQGSAASLPASSGADAQFSYTLQGKPISGGPTDVTQMSNVAHIEKNEKGTTIQFFLNDTYDEKASAFAHSLRVAVPSKTGTTQLMTDGGNGHVELFVSKGLDGAYVVYGNETFTVTIDAISATRISGSFSGKVKSVSEPAEELTIADGKFNMPLGTSSK